MQKSLCKLNIYRKIFPYTITCCFFIAFWLLICKFFRNIAYKSNLFTFSYINYFLSWLLCHHYVMIIKYNYPYILYIFKLIHLSFLNFKVHIFKLSIYLCSTISIIILLHYYYIILLYIILFNYNVMSKINEDNFNVNNNTWCNKNNWY